MCAHSFERVFKPHEGPGHLDCDLIKRLTYFGESSSVRRRFDKAGEIGAGAA
jgi:hypothetical protein